MKRADVAIATMTRARDRDDERLIGRALRRLSLTSMPIAVADGGSSGRFIDAMRRLPGVTVVDPEHDGLVGQVQASVTKARETGRAFILYTEPDKGRFFGRALIDFIRRARADAGIVLASRSPASFGTFPRFQRFTETAASELCRMVTGMNTDYFYGPFLLNRRLARQVSRAPRTLGWGWRPYLFATAHRLGHSVQSVRGDYPCPSGQRREDDHERQHRARQLAENARGVLTSICGRG